MLALRSVGKRFGNVLALSGIDLDLAAGDFLVLLGPSGCGKSTLLRLLAGLDTPGEGTLHWTEGPPAPGTIGFVFQDATLMPWASAAENVALPLLLRGATDARARATAVLRSVGLQAFAAARPAQLSGGMRMRVSLARALVARPKLLLMDEPFAALDEFTRHALQDRLLHLVKDFGCITVFVTHSLYEAAYLGSRIVLMSPSPGRIAREFAGTPGADRLSPDYAALVSTLSHAAQESRLV